MVRDGYRVRVLDDQSRGSVERLADIKTELKFVPADISFLEAVPKATDGMDGVCHLAFVNGTEYFYTKPDFVLDVGVKGVVNVLDLSSSIMSTSLFWSPVQRVYALSSKLSLPMRGSRYLFLTR